MNKLSYLILVIAVVIISGGAFVLWGDRDQTPIKNPPVPPIVIVDPLNATYLIDGSPVVLVNGKAETGTGSAKVSTSVFGQPVIGDLNGDGADDAALFMTQNRGGSGVFYYVAASIAATTGTHGTNGFLIGDRVAPQNIQVNNGRISANYADRKPGQPMTTAPSVGMTTYYTVDGFALKTAATPLTSITFLTSKEDSTKYCNGVDMNSAGYQKTITVKNTTTTAESNPTNLQIIKETIHAATTGMCRTVLDQLSITESNGIVTIPAIDGWAGSSIVMCSCKPIVETNVLQIPGMTQVVWR